jgi:hypothetical protein
MDIVNIISAAGIGGIIGSLLTTVAQAYYAHKSHLNDRSFQEKKEAYAGYLDAIYKSDIQRSEEAALYCGHWINRCELVASKEVIKALETILKTNPINGNIHPDRPPAMHALKEAMRKDLGI